MKITADMAGCWLEGSRGIYAASALVHIALGYGYLHGATRSETMHARTEARHVLRAYDASDDTAKYRRKPKYGASYTVTVEDVFELVNGHGGYADEAEDFLNTLAPEGYWFGWSDGEFFLGNEAWWDEVSPG